MFNFSWLYLLLAFKTVTCTCNPEKRMGFTKPYSQNNIKKSGKLHQKENSGLIYLPKSKTVLTHGDSGTEPKLIETTLKGEKLKEIKLKGLKNKDWEDITKDNNQNIFIGDFGNNALKRKDLCIYKVFETVEKIEFVYENNEKHDCEAFFWFNNRLYLITKSWKKKKKMAYLYELPDIAGKHVAKKVDAILLDVPVTAADINADNTEFALLTYGKVIIFKIVNETINFKEPKYCVKTRRKQTEGITYTQGNDLLFSNEQGNLYTLIK